MTDAPERPGRRRIRLRALRSVPIAIALIAAATAATLALAEHTATPTALADGPTATLSTPGSGNVLTGLVSLQLATTADIASVQYEYMAADVPASQTQWTTLPGNPTSAPFNAMTFDSTALPTMGADEGGDGLYDLRAVVTDTSGATITSNTLSDRLVANSSPVLALSLLIPGDNSSQTTLSGNQVTLSAVDSSGDQNANLLDSATAEFQYSPAGEEDWTTVPGAGSLTADANGAFTATFDSTSVPDGLYDFQVVVTSDANGLVDYALPARGVLIDNTPPTVSMTAPASPLAGLVTVSANAADSGSGVGEVDFQIERASSGDWVTFGSATAAPYTATLNTRNTQYVPANGAYDLRAIATDNAGNAATSTIVSGVTVDNASEPPPVSATVTNVVAPASDIGMLGTITAPESASDGSGDTWAYGLTSGAPAEVDGQRLPYTATGAEVVLLRSSASGAAGAGGDWQVVDVLRNANDSPFQLLPSADLQGSPYLTGAMAADGEAWLFLSEQPTAASGKSAVVGLFHREPGGSFTLDPEFDPSSPSYNAALVAMLKSDATASSVNHAELTLGAYTAGQPLAGVITAPSQPQAQASVTPPAGGQAVQIDTRLEYALLQSDGSWRVDSVPTSALPASYVPRSGDVLTLTNAAVSATNVGWGALKLGGNQRALPLILGKFAGGNWTFAPAGAAPLDLTGKDAVASGSPVDPTALRLFGTDLWIGASASDGAPIVAEIDTASGAATSWCATGSVTCTEYLPANELSVPDAVFPTANGPVALGLGSGVVNVFAYGVWSQVAAPGYAGVTSADATFSDRNEGWLVGGAALGHWTVGASSPLVSWPLPDRAPLTAIAVPTSSNPNSTELQAVAVGLSGTTLYYDADNGWLPASLPSTWQYAAPPPQAGSINLLGVAFDGPTDAFAVGQYGAILRWDGSAWSEDPQSFALTKAALNAVAFEPDGEGWAVGAAGTILHYDGQSWSAQRPPSQDQLSDITSVAVAGSRVYAVAGGNLISLTPEGTWATVAASQLPNDPVPSAGSLRLVAGLPDGGIVAAGINELLTSQSAGQPFVWSAQPLAGIAVALAPYRQSSGNIGAFVSVAPPVPGANDVGGSPPGDGELLRLTDSGWQDLSQAQYPNTVAGGCPPQGGPSDGSTKSDPVLAVASDPSGQHAWAVGGYAGTVSASCLGTYADLSARPAGWDSASIWRYDESGATAPPQLTTSTPDLPAQQGVVSFAYFSSPECRWECTAVSDAQPDTNLSSAASEISTYAQQPGGPSFAVFGGNDRGPAALNGSAVWDAREEYARLPGLLAPLGSLPLFGAVGPLDDPPTSQTDDPAHPLEPWADVFEQVSPPPLGDAAPGANINPVSASPPVQGVGVSDYYAFDAQQNGGTLRVIVLDNSSGSLGTAQTNWLAGQLAAGQSAGVPMVAIAGEPLRVTGGGALDGTSVATMLANAGVLAVFTTNPSQLNQQYMVPTYANPGQPQIPEYEGASLGCPRPRTTASRGTTFRSTPSGERSACRRFRSSTRSRSSRCRA